MASIANQLEEEPLPAHWERRTDQTTGLPFFLNHADQTTTWDDPRCNTQPRGMLNSMFAGSSPRINRKSVRDPFFESFGDNHGFFQQTTLPRNRGGGLRSRFIDMDQWFHSRDQSDEVEQPDPQPQWATLDRRRMKPRRVQPQHSDANIPQEYASLPRFKRRDRFSEPPCTERLYGKPNAADFQIPVRHQNENRYFDRADDEEEQTRPSNRLFVRLWQKPDQLPRQEEVMSPEQVINEPTQPVYKEPRQPMQREYSIPEPNHQTTNEPSEQPEVEEKIIIPTKNSKSADDTQRPTGLHMTSQRSPSPMDNTPDTTAQEKPTEPETNQPSETTADPETDEAQADENEAEQKQAAIDAALAKIAEIRKRVDGYKLEVSDFKGDEKSKEYRYLTEMLTRATLDLDMIESLGETIIRTKRKETIKYIDMCTEQLESKCQTRTN